MLPFLVAFINVLNVLSSALALYLLIIVYRMRIKGRAHYLLGLAAAALFAWNSLAYFVYNTGSPALLEILLPLSCLPMYLFFALVAHFAHALYRKRPLAMPARLALYTPAIALGLASFFVPVSLEPIVTSAGTVRLQVPVGSVPTSLWSLYAVGCWVGALILAVRYYRGTRLNREKGQGSLLVQWLIINLVLVLGEFYATAMLDWWTIPSQSPLLMSMWVGAMVYAIWKYGFLRISPGLLSEQILDSIEDMVLLYDMQGNRVYANHRAAALLGGAGTIPILGRSSGATGPRDPFAETVSSLLAGAQEWKLDEPERQFRRQIPGSAPGRSTLTTTVRAKPVFDRFEDPMGIIITATIQPQLHDLLRPYQLTEREAEVLEYLAAGLSIGATARTLSITERTVKAHITSIYQKTGATNRVELLNMVASV